jgi:LmbE family N-acetylglucosaminyl deacetylase
MDSPEAQYLVISPHPDDAEFGAAGTVAGLTAKGQSVAYVVCTSGDKGTDDPNVNPDDLARIREEEQRQAAAVLGVKNVVFLHYPDQGLEDTPEFRKRLVEQIRIFRPEVVITSDPYRRYIWHRDHRIVGRAVLDAVFPYARDHWSYPDLTKRGLEPHKTKEVWLWAANEEDINFRSDITDTYETKLKALRCHKSQVKDKFSDEMEKWLCTRAKDMAEGEKFRLAEGFHRAVIWF